MTGACLTVSQVQSIPWSAAPSSTALLLVTSAFVTPIVRRGMSQGHVRSGLLQLQKRPPFSWMYKRAQCAGNLGPNQGLNGTGFARVRG